jgi:hypothetical protein
MFCLYRCQILALDSTLKDLNCWCKVAIISIRFAADKGWLGQCHNHCGVN